MSTHNTNLPMRFEQPPKPDGDDIASLFIDLLARIPPQPASHEAANPALRSRLLERLAASRAAEAAMFTVRRRRLPSESLAAGAVAQTLYAATPGQALRAGEPLRARLIELGAGVHLAPEALGAASELKLRHREWLVLSGSVKRGDEWLSQRDYHVTPAGHDTPDWTAAEGALLFLRESEPQGAADQSPITVRDADAGWPDFAPGIQRRVLWQFENQAAMLYYAQPGAQVPEHTHGHDEECLMVQGDLFLDDVLLQPGDYQLAPAGTGHRTTTTDTGVVIYAHGDLALKLVA